ncbi:MAG: cation-translocating P-type ATPase [Lachnospiraceae bacterium]|nr:cation-translocating P-type ATPase [Lachnospiraceae bacterium]
MKQKNVTNAAAPEPDLPDRKPLRHRYKATVDAGLNTKQVNEYLEAGWDNAPVDPPSKSVEEIIKSNVLTYFNIVFLIIAILLIAGGSYRHLTFLPVIIFNTLIGIVQELNAKKTLDKLSVLHAPHAMVVRNSKARSIAAADLVLDDIVIFGSGNQVCADAQVIQGEVQVNESLLTGESDEITKRPGDHLMSGSFIVSGSCYSRLTNVGRDSYISKLTLEAKASREGEQSEMIRTLNKLLLIIGIAIIPIGLTLFYQAYFVNENTFRTSISSMAAGVLGMIPEGLFLLCSVTLAVSTVRLAGKKVLVHDMKCIETLARVDVLCVDKTGTITENEMKVNNVHPLPGYAETLMSPLDELIGDFAHAMSRDNSTMATLQQHFQLQSGRVASETTGFSSAFKYSSATFGRTSYVLGAPEFVLRETYKDYEQEIMEYSEQGYRVLVFCIYHGVPDGKALTAGVTPLCLITLSNPIRGKAPDTFRFFAENDVAIKVISGDNPVTVSKIAAQAGIQGAESYVDARSLDTEEEIEAAMDQYTVFGRVTPEQKRFFVKALQKAGHTVAMTGDGVNDVLALKDADCSVAMASGSDAACQAAQLVLLENDFSRMTDVVMEGRQVVNNLERSGSLFLVKNLFSLMMSLFSIIFNITYPLDPSQITLISTFTIGMPGFFLSQVPDHNRIQGRFLTNILVRALPAGLTDTLIVGALVVFGQTFNLDSVDVGTACTILLAIVGFMILFQISKPMNSFKWAIFGVSVFGLFFCAYALGDLFSMTSMSTRTIMLFVIFSICTEPLFRYLTALVKYCSRLCSYLWREYKRVRGTAE